MAARDQAAVGTGVMETGKIEIEGRWQGSELALLLSVRAFGGSSWPGAARAARPITSPHELKVCLEYEGGERHSSFLWSPLRRAWTVEEAPLPYVVALEPGKTLTRIVLEDNMNFGQIFLNLKGRQPGGCVEPADAPALRRDLKAGLLEIRHPGTGEPLVERVHEGDELYHGPYAHLAPDLTVAEVRAATAGRLTVAPDLKEMMAEEVVAL
jgi:hypothetical protein